MPNGNGGSAASAGDAAADKAARAAAAIQRQVESERIASLQALIPPTLVGGSAFACVISALLYAVAPHGLVLAWLGIRLGVTAWRAWDVHAFRAARVPMPAGTRPRTPWRTRLFVALWIDAALWSALPLAFMPWIDALGAGMMVSAIVGVVAVGTFSLSAHRTASTGFLLVVLVPLMLQQALMGTEHSVAVAVSLGIFGAVLFVECERSHRRFSDMVKLRFENAAIAEQRQRALIYAEHSNAAKTRFLAAVSHELRTPLNGILGMTQLMADEPLSTMQQRSLQVVQHSAEHLVSVIGDLLDLSRIEMDRVALDPKPTLVAQTLRDVADLLRPVALDRGLAFQAAVHPSVPKVAVFDAGRVKQVLHILVGNAIKFTAKGEIRVIARMADAQRLSFEVRDTGEGIPPDAIDRIFEPFEQASPSLPSRGGAGLGLTLARQFARAMGGDVVVRSTTGEGSRFRFTIAYVATDEEPVNPRGRLATGAVVAEPAASPTAASASAASSSPSSAAPAAPAAAPTRRKADSGVGGRVLIVEDNEVNALVVRGMLDQLGIESDRVTDGRQAIDVLARQGTDRHPRYDLVLMDCQMPILDGWSATREWRRTERGPGLRPRTRPGVPARLVPPGKRLPIVALTASAAAGERERCLEAGMDDYLSKPFTREELLRVLRPFLSTGEPLPAPPGPREAGPRA
jgi:signal transduction histidine kinase/CheY-like chemotaxis protein